MAIGPVQLPNGNVAFWQQGFGLAQGAKSWYGKSLRLRQGFASHCGFWSTPRRFGHTPSFVLLLGFHAARLCCRAEPRRRASDCSDLGLPRQQLKSMDFSNRSKRPTNVPPWQRLSAIAVALIYLVLLSTAEVPAQIHDALDTHPPRWNLADSDCQARIINQGHLATGGIEDGSCETVTMVAGHGTEALLVYPIEPVLPIDDLRANVSVFCAKAGARIGFRVRYPFLRDPETRSAVSVVVYGATYDSVGTFASIGVGMIEKQLRLKNVALRNEHGRSADLNDAYVDGVVINAYGGQGTTSLRLDELRIAGMVPVDAGVVTGNARSNDGPHGKVELRRVEGPNDRGSNDEPARYRSAFPTGKIIRILQYNGEPLSWVRSLGFDAVLLSQPPDSIILSEAIRSQVMVYAPPPSSPDPTLNALLEPIAGWYIGSGQAIDSRHVEQTKQESDRLRGWPQRWQRPIISAPAESWRHYAPLVDGIVDDLPPRVRGLQPSEEVAQMVMMRGQIGDRVETAVGIQSMPPPSLVRQTEAIADAIGSPHPSGFHWHSMWLQTMRSLETTPTAILYRSTRSLASGSPLDSQRSMALSYVNRMVAMISPWVSKATPATPPVVTGAPYQAARLTYGPTEMFVITSTAARGSEVLSGDGTVIDIHLTPADATKTAWRLTHFSAERLQSETSETGTRLQIVSPDAAEIIVLSSDPAVGGQFSRSASRFARQAALDRWQLATELVQRTEQEWTAAKVARAVSGGAPQGLITAAQQTMVDAESIYRSGQTAATLRMARRADAWALRSQWQLSEALMPNWPNPTSSPPVSIGAADVQTMWRGLMNEPGWGSNRLTSGGLDDPNLFATGRWQVGRRLTGRAASEVSVVKRGSIDGGALRATVSPLTDENLPGGYEGTVVQIQSPAVRVPTGTAIRIDAMVHTIGFGGPHQGVLIYDTIGGQEAGVLVRGRPNWVPVRIYRQAVADADIHVMFELLGAGEAKIDNVSLRLWEPTEPRIGPPIRPLAAELGTESTNR